jgi:hypothetical protein
VSEQVDTTSSSSHWNATMKFSMTEQEKGDL